MEHEEKFYLVNINYDGFKKDHKIAYNMPPFCEGVYEAIIYEDEKGLYIKEEDNWFKGCRSYYIVPQSVT